VGITKMSPNILKDELWTRTGDNGLSSKYYDETDLAKRTRVRNLIFISSFLVYLIVSAALILF
jgi:hypothetical protein